MPIQYWAFGASLPFGYLARSCPSRSIAAE